MSLYIDNGISGCGVNEDDKPLGEPAEILGPLEERKTKRRRSWKETEEDQRQAPWKCPGHEGKKKPGHKMFQKSLEAAGISFAWPSEAQAQPRTISVRPLSYRRRNECCKPQWTQS